MGFNLKDVAPHISIGISQSGTIDLNGVENEHWFENTDAHPFFKSQTPVEVILKGGKRKVFTCPRCATGMFSEVLRWRAVA